MDEKIKAEVLESNKDEKKIDIEDNKTENNNEVKNNKNETKQEEKNVNHHEFKQVKVKKKKNKIVAISVIMTIILILGILVSTIFALLNSNNNTILSGIYVKDTLIEGMTEEEAINLLNQKFEEEKKTELILKINGETYTITPEQIEVEYDVEKAVEEAYSIGRSGNIFQNNYEILFAMIEENNIGIEITYNEELLNTVLEGFNAKLPNVMVDNTYCIEDNELIITRGIDGIVIDIETAKEVILENIRKGNNEEFEIKTVFQKCPEIDIEKIYEEVKSEPQDASYTTDPFEVIPHKNGLDFDIEEAKKILSEDKEEYVINLIVTEPEILTNEIGDGAFPDLLSSFSTKYDESNVSRSKNVKLAMSKLDGVVVMPGEVFSYNETLGKRTAEAGYEYANGFAGGKVVPMLAGGICQVSSTLYDAVLYANLDIVERYNHMFQATYVEPGKDATVVYGSLDFKFENTRSYPIMIKAKASGGLAEIKIFGIKEAVEYEVEVITEVLSYTPYKVVYENDSSLAPGQEKVSQWGLQGCKSITYRIVKLNGQQVSKEVLSTDTYDPLSKIIKVGPAKQSSVNTSTKPSTEKKEPIETPVEPEQPETEGSQEQEEQEKIEETPSTETPSTPTENPSTETPSTQEPSTENTENTDNKDNTEDMGSQEPQEQPET